MTVYIAVILLFLNVTDIIDRLDLHETGARELKVNLYDHDCIFSFESTLAFPTSILFQYDYTIVNKFKSLALS